MLDGLPNLLVLQSVRTGAALIGALVGALAVVTLFVGIIRRTPRLGVSEGALSGISLGLLAGILGGCAFTFAQSLQGIGRFAFAGGVGVGVAMGSVLGWLGVLAIATHRASPRGLALGASIGLLAGLIAFRFAFGTFAGVGPEYDIGVGPEVGALLGLVGTLLGALVSRLISGRSRQGIRWARIGWGSLGGAGVGLLVSLLIALIGWQTDVQIFILPGVAPAYAMPGGAVVGSLYGLGVFALVGALLGALAGTLTDGGWGHAIGLAVGLGLSAIAGLMLGLSHTYIGGPHITGQRLTYDPAGTQWGLLTGLAAGLAVGALCWLALRWSEQRPRTHAVVVAVLLLALGVALIFAPMWFHPLFGVDIK